MVLVWLIIVFMLLEHVCFVLCGERCQACFNWRWELCGRPHLLLRNSPQFFVCRRCFTAEVLRWGKKLWKAAAVYKMYQQMSLQCCIKKLIKYFSIAAGPSQHIITSPSFYLQIGSYHQNESGTEVWDRKLQKMSESMKKWSCPIK